MLKTQLIIFLLSWLPVALVAQQMPDVLKDEKGKYYLHLVEQGQTLYAISKKYSVSVEVIQKANPEVEISGLKIGQALRIPHEEVDQKELKKSEITIVNDTIIHKVAKQETLYSISKKYNLSITEIAAINPHVNEGLQIGMEIKIPYAQSNDADAENMQFAREDSLVLHVVRPKETLFALSKEYGISIDSIQIANQGLPEGLKVGSTIRIPKKNPRFELVNSQYKHLEDSLKEAGWAQEKAYRVALFLPLYLPEFEKTDTTAYTTEDKQKREVYSKSKIGLDFLRGANIAIDSLGKKGLWAEFEVFDTHDHPDSLVQYFKKSRVETFDMCIGPFFRSHFDQLSEVSKSKFIPMINPVKVPSRVLLDKPHTIKVYPSQTAELVGMAKYVARHYADSNLFMLNSGRFNDQENAEIFRNQINRFLGEQSRDTLPQVSMYTVSRAKLDALFKDNTSYTIVVPSTNQAYVSTLLTMLNDIYISKRGIRFRVFGMEKWFDYDNIESAYLMNLRVHIPGSRYVDYSSDLFVNLAGKYREKHGTDPSEFALLGFDVTYYFGNILQKHGPFFMRHLNEYKATLSSTRFDFVKVGEVSGYENQGVFIHTIENYQLKLVY